MSGLGLLLAPTYRSRAIVQLFLHLGIEIESALILPDKAPAWDGEESIELDFYKRDGSFTFRPNMPIEQSLKGGSVPYEVAPTNDVNTQEFITCIQKQSSDVYIYSGVAGCILSAELLQQSGKKFIHAHGGDAPRYSGSTAFYYSLLETGTIGATVFWMDEGLDTGDVIDKVIAPPHENVEIDRIQDPLIRAEAFASALEKIGAGVSAYMQDHTKRVTYHVIHPVLKHLALKKIMKENS